MRANSRIRTRRGRFTNRPSAASRLGILGLFTMTMSCSITVYFKSLTPEVAQAQVLATEIELGSPSVASTSAGVSEQKVAATSGGVTFQPLAGQNVATSSSELSAKAQSVEIDKAVQEFLPARYSEALMIMHCLAHRENGHGGNPDAHGDNGLAGGPFQFHQATWNRMRGQMIKAGYATELGSRYDFKESARTTAWALANGRAKEWGPILRDSKGSDFATCQTPSWSK